MHPAAEALGVCSCNMFCTCLVSVCSYSSEFVDIKHCVVVETRLGRVVLAGKTRDLNIPFAHHAFLLVSPDST